MGWFNRRRSSRKASSRRPKIPAAIAGHYWNYCTRRECTRIHAKLPFWLPALIGQKCDYCKKTQKSHLAKRGAFLVVRSSNPGRPVDLEMDGVTKFYPKPGVRVDLMKHSEGKYGFIVTVDESKNWVAHTLEAHAADCKRQSGYVAMLFGFYSSLEVAEGRARAVVAEDIEPIQKTAGHQRNPGRRR